MSLGRTDVKIAANPTGAGEPVKYKEGWLHKEGGGARTKWQSRWFKLQDKTLSYYQKKEDHSSSGSINLDEVKDISVVGDHSGRRHCFSMVTTKSGSKKVYYLSAESDVVVTDWTTALKTNMSTYEPPTKFIKYCTVEVFLSQGVRIMGDVHYNILTQISHRMAADKKKRDNFGWFCDRQITLAAVLNLFAEYGWIPERIYRSTAVSGNDVSLILPVVRTIFSKCPPAAPVEDSTPRKKNLKGLFGKFSPHGSPNLNARPESSGKFEGSGRFGDAVSVSTQKVASSPTITPGTEMIEGADDELIALMEEFNIPLSLLQLPAE